MYEKRVLIETYWNVNEYTDAYGKVVRLGINRNILECKYYQTTVATNNAWVLIETYWNVNF